MAPSVDCIGRGCSFPASAIAQSVEHRAIGQGKGRRLRFKSQGSLLLAWTAVTSCIVLSDATEVFMAAFLTGAVALPVTLDASQARHALVRRLAAVAKAACADIAMAQAVQAARRCAGSSPPRCVPPRGPCTRKLHTVQLAGLSHAASQAAKPGVQVCSPAVHRSHFGSRYTFGCCGTAGRGSSLFARRSKGGPAR